MSERDELSVEWDDIYMDAESNGEGEPRAMVRYAYLAGRRAAEAALREENAAWRQVWDNVRIDVPNLREDNKPLAVAASYALLKRRAEVADEENARLLEAYQLKTEDVVGLGKQLVDAELECERLRVAFKRLRDDANDCNRILGDACERQSERAEAAEAQLRAVPREHYQHAKTGGYYTFLFQALLESTRQLMAVYESEGGERWVRPISEFRDGRFLRIDDAAQRPSVAQDQSTSRCVAHNLTVCEPCLRGGTWTFGCHPIAAPSEPQGDDAELCEALRDRYAPEYIDGQPTATAFEHTLADAADRIESLAAQLAAERDASACLRNDIKEMQRNLSTQEKAADKVGAAWAIEQQRAERAERELAACRADALEEAAKICESFGRAHTYASENADHYRGFDAGIESCAKRIRARANAARKK